MVYYSIRIWKFIYNCTDGTGQAYETVAPVYGKRKKQREKKLDTTYQHTYKATDHSSHYCIVCLSLHKTQTSSIVFTYLFKLCSI